jgi:hypothetical protein
MQAASGEQTLASPPHSDSESERRFPSAVPLASTACPQPPPESNLTWADRAEPRAAPSPRSHAELDGDAAWFASDRDRCGPCASRSKRRPSLVDPSSTLRRAHDSSRATYELSRAKSFCSRRFAVLLKLPAGGACQSSPSSKGRRRGCIKVRRDAAVVTSRRRRNPE